MPPTVPPFSPAWPIQAQWPAALVALPWLNAHGQQADDHDLELRLARLAQVARSAHNHAVLNVAVAMLPATITAWAAIFTTQKPTAWAESSSPTKNNW